MLRATSEMAVAMRVVSVCENPISVARSRPNCLAATMSASDAIGMRTSCISVPEDRIEKCEPFFEVDRGVDLFEAHPQLHHRERHLGLNADNDRHRAAQAGHVGD